MGGEGIKTGERNNSECIKQGSPAYQTRPVFIGHFYERAYTPDADIEYSLKKGTTRG